MLGRNYYFKMHNFNTNCVIDQKDLKMNENYDDRLEIALLGRDCINNGIIDNLIKQLETKYKITKINKYNETNEQSLGPGKFIRDILEKYDCEYGSLTYRPFEMADSSLLKRMITISDAMYINCTHDDEILSLWDKFHYYGRMSLYDNYLSLMNNPQKFERKHLRYTFRNTIQKMKNTDMELPKDYSPHYLVTEKLWIDADGDKYDTMINFRPYLKEENALKECEVLNKTHGYLSRSITIDSGDIYYIVLKKEIYA